VFMNWMTTSWSTAHFAGNTPSGAGVTDFQVQATGPTSTHNPTLANTAVHIASGQSVTINFRGNMTWTDGFPITAKDYNFSLYMDDLAGSPTLPDVLSPPSYTMAGPAGLISDKCTYTPTPAAPGGSCTMYLGSYNVWNVGSLQILVLPQHLLSFFNPDLFDSYGGTINPTETYAYNMAHCAEAGTASPGYPQTCYNIDMNSAHTNSPPAWVLAEPNLFISSGPYFLQTYSGVSGAGELYANAYYHRAAWWVNATSNVVAPTASSIVLHVPKLGLYTSTGWQWITPTTVTAQSCKSPAAGAVLDYSTTYKSCALAALPSGVTVGSYAVTGGRGSVTLSGTTNKFPAGEYEIAITFSFTYAGQARTFTFFTGIKTSPCAQARTVHVYGLAVDHSYHSHSTVMQVSSRWSCA